MRALLRDRRVRGVLVVLVMVLGGRWAGAEDFSIVVIPDPQNYARKFHEVGLSQTQWIKENVGKLQIRFVTSVGDNVDFGASDAQFKKSAGFFDVLDGAVPYGIACGNHDLMDGKKGFTGVKFVEYFGAERFKKYPWYGGASESGFSSYQMFTAGERKIMAIQLAVNAPAAEIAWAKKVMGEHPTMPVILTTHQMITPKGELGKGFAAKGPGRQLPEQMWDQLIKTSGQIGLVICGHYCGESHIAKTNDAGRKVQVVLQDYQDEAEGGNGWLRIFRFQPEVKKVKVQTYSPWLKKYKTDGKNEFEFEMEMGGGEKSGEEKSR